MKNVLSEMKDLDLNMKKYLCRNNTVNIENLNMTQFQIIRYLGVRQNKVTQNELADFLKIKKSSVSGALVSLEEKGLICRTASSEDRRNKFVSLSQKAIDRNLKLAAMFESTNDKMLADISEDDLAIFLKVLNKMKENLEVTE